MLRMARHARKETNSDYLCLAGGVALNCVANGKILRENIFKDIWIQPAAGDAGGALGAGLAVWHGHFKNPKSKFQIPKSEDKYPASSIQHPESNPKFKIQNLKSENEHTASNPNSKIQNLNSEEISNNVFPVSNEELQHSTFKIQYSTLADQQKGSYLGPLFNNEEIASFLIDNSIPNQKHEDDVLFRKVAELLAGERVIGWFQGPMEFGPRALGSRSILGDARSPKMQREMNLKIKFRESFRPFAPAVLAEEVENYFEIDRPSPYMLLVADVKKNLQRKMTNEEEKLSGIDKLNVARSKIPAITHVDYSARIQTVHRETNPGFHNLLSEFHRITGCPVLINTSFNVRGEPIVCTPEDAYKCFMRTNMDYLVLGNYLLDKKDQPEFHDTIDWRVEFDLD